MKYSAEDFVRLMDAVEEEGGVHLDETCTQDEIVYPDPAGGRSKVTHTHGCEDETLFEIPYDPDEDVEVPEPVLEPDPNRGTYYALSGEKRKVMRSVVEEDPHTGEKHTAVKWVMREGEDFGGLIPVVVCAVGDSMGMWPRFAGVIEDKGSH